MVLETFLKHGSHHHHHHHHLHLHHHHDRHRVMMAKPIQAMEYEDLSNVMIKASSHDFMRKVKSERIAKDNDDDDDENVDNEAEKFINLKHMKFSKCI
ncbi:unnamed protein product [Cochlearia groenlandica]